MERIHDFLMCLSSKEVADDTTWENFLKSGECAVCDEAIWIILGVHGASGSLGMGTFLFSC